jgi:hypothetical protein
MEMVPMVILLGKVDVVFRTEAIITNLFRTLRRGVSGSFSCTDLLLD